VSRYWAGRHRDTRARKGNYYMQVLSLQ